MRSIDAQTWDPAMLFRDPSSTTIYAKVNLAALREVAALDLEGLA